MHIDWTMLTLFTRLKSLKLTCVDYEVGELCESVKNMLGLTELRIRFYDVNSDDDDDVYALDFVSPLTALQALGLEVYESFWLGPDLPCALHEMTQLTKLHIKGSVCVAGMECLTRMVDLKIVMYQIPSVVLMSALQSMTRLESLYITNEARSVALPSSLFRQLMHLKRLALFSLPVELDFFQALATLSGLTELHFVPRNHKQLDSHAFRSQVNLLTRLRVLEIAFGTTDISPLEYALEGCLLRLRDISFICSHFGEDEEKELRRRLPCLEEINFYY